MRTYETVTTARINLFDQREDRHVWAILPVGARVEVVDWQGDTVTVRDLASEITGQVAREVLARYTP